jgi:hypothetical protein
VIPSDEVAIRLLFELVRDPPRHLGGGGLCYQNVAAWQGRYLAGYAGDRLEADSSRANTLSRSRRSFRT